MPNAQTDDDDTDDVVGAPAPVKITAPEPDDDGDDDDAPGDGGDPAARQVLKDNKGGPRQPGERPGTPGTRAERKNLWRQNQELRDELKRVSGSIESLTKGHQENLNRMRDEILSKVQPQQRQGQGETTDPIAKAQSDVGAAINAEIRLMRQHDPEKGDYDLSRYNQLVAQRDKLNTQAALAEMGLTPAMVQQLQRGQQQRPTPGVEPHHAARFERLSEEFPWMNDGTAKGDEAVKLMGSYRNHLMRGEGRPDSITTDREAALYVQNQMQLGPRRAPRTTETQQRRYGVPRGGEEMGVGGRRAPREISVDPRLLEGTGLSRDAVGRALFREDDE